MVAMFAVLPALAAPTSAAPAGAPPPTAQPGIDLFAIDSAAQPLVADSEKAYHAGNLRHALILLQKAEKAAPNDGTVHLLLGRMMLQMSFPASAERELREARQDGAADHIALPSLFAAMLQRQEAQGLLDEFADPGPAAQGDITADILKGRAEAFLALDQTAEAAATMDRSLSLRRDVLGLVTRAQIATKQNNPELARNLADEALKRDPRNGHALVEKLALLVDANDDAGILALSDRILKQYPAALTAMQAKIDVLLKHHQDEKAKVQIKVLETAARGQPITRYYQSLMLSRANNFRAAWDIAQALSPDFTNSQPSYAIAVSEMAAHSGFVQAGASILGAALTKWPDSLELRSHLAGLQIDQNNLQAALRILEPVKDSQDPQILVPLTQIYLKTGKMDEALAAARKVQQLDPKRAVRLLDYAVWAAPHSADFADALGASMLAMNDAKGAAAQLGRAHALRPADGEITFHLVQALYASGNPSSAKGLLKSLLDSRIRFVDQPAALNLAMTWHMAGQTN
jgi:predicted Zn-dependent protease